MSKKILWLDLETTGTDSRVNSITEIAAIYKDLDNPETEDIFHEYVHYASYPDDYDEVAKITGLTPEILAAKGITEKQCYQRFITYLTDKVNRFDRGDKIIIAGFNVKSFDSQFIRQLWNRNDDRYFGSYFESICIDVMSTVAEAKLDGKIAGIPNNKLSTVCQFFGIEFEAHSALADVKATIELYETIKKSYEL